MTQQNHDDPVCHGNGLIVCCFLPGGRNEVFGDGICPYLEVGTTLGRHWVCSFRRRHSSWEEVHQDPEYIANVQSVWRANDPPTPDCGNWRLDGQCCFGDNPPVYEGSAGEHSLTGTEVQGAS